MKKILFSLLLFACPFVVQAQSSKHEVTLGYGVGSTSEIINTFADILTTGITAGTYTSNETYTGTFHFGYKYRITNRFSLGGTFLYESGKSNAEFQQTVIGKFDNKYYTLAAESEFRYLSKDFFSVYGVFGLGATLFSQKYTPTDDAIEKDEKVHFNFQISPIGIKVGKSIGAFAEAGFGYKGIISAGVFARF